jgi:hypothetical protein
MTLSRLVLVIAALSLCACAMQPVVPDTRPITLYYPSQRITGRHVPSQTQREREAIEREMMKRGLLNPVTTPQEIRPTPEIEYGNPRPNI